MATKAQIQKFAAEGEILNTYPLWEDIKIEAIQNYAPSENQKNGGYNLKLEAKVDPDDPNNWVGRYTKFGTSSTGEDDPQWSTDAMIFLRGLILDINPRGTLVARNLADHNVEDPNWRVTAFRISKLGTPNQLTSMEWRGPDAFGNPDKRVYKHTYTWPPC